MGRPLARWKHALQRGPVLSLEKVLSPTVDCQGANDDYVKTNQITSIAFNCLLNLASPFYEIGHK